MQFKWSKARPKNFDFRLSYRIAGLEAFADLSGARGRVSWKINSLPVETIETSPTKRMERTEGCVCRGERWRAGGTVERRENCVANE